jgi:hypothetical protein
MITRTIADLTFEVHAPHQYRLVHTDPDYADHDVWILFDGDYWWLSVFIGENRHDRRFNSRAAVLSLLTNRRMAV